MSRQCNGRVVTVREISCHALPGNAPNSQDYSVSYSYIFQTNNIFKLRNLVLREQCWRMLDIKKTQPKLPWNNFNLLLLDVRVIS